MSINLNLHGNFEILITLKRIYDFDFFFFYISLQGIGLFANGFYKYTYITNNIAI